MVIAKNGDITLEKNDCDHYAIFRRVSHPSGTTAFWQQVTIWYFCQKYAEKIYNSYIAKKSGF